LKLSKKFNEFFNSNILVPKKSSKKNKERMQQTTAAGDEASKAPEGGEGSGNAEGGE
jgi:hypothetical protein